MKTFLSFTTGLLCGIAVGFAGTVYIYLDNKNVREFAEENAFDSDKTERA